MLSETDSTISNPITYDSYAIKVDMSSNGVDRSASGTGGFPRLYFNDTASGGGYEIRATQNMPFEAIVPSVQNVTVPELISQQELEQLLDQILEMGLAHQHLFHLQTLVLKMLP